MKWRETIKSKEHKKTIQEWIDRLNDVNRSISFDKTNHRYYYKQKEFISVSKRLEFMAGGMLAMSGTKVMEDATKRGTAIHELTEEWDLGNIPMKPEDYNEELLPYLKAYKQFIEEHQPIYIRCEQRVFYSQWETSGTIDRIYVRENSKGDLILGILDLKTGGHTLKNIHQLHMYASMLQSVLGIRKPIEKNLLYLSSTGIYKMRRVI